MDGFDLAYKRLVQAINNNSLPHALMVTGAPNDVCARFLRLAASKITLGNDNVDALEACPDCIILSSLGVDDIRAMHSELSKRPFMSVTRCVMVTFSHLMTAQAQNALLKTLEEPPANTVFLLCGSLFGLLPTIRSRLTIIRLGICYESEAYDEAVKISAVNALIDAVTGVLTPNSIRALVQNAKGHEAEALQCLIDFIGEVQRSAIIGAFNPDVYIPSLQGHAEMLVKSFTMVQIGAIIRTLIESLGRLKAGSTLAAVWDWLLASLPISLAPIPNK